MEHQADVSVVPPAHVAQTKNKATAAACETPPSKKSKVSAKVGGGASLITGFFTKRSETQPQDAETTPKPACHQKPAAPSPRQEDEVPAVRTLDMLAEDSSDGNDARQQQERGHPSTTATPGDCDRKIVAELIEDEPVCDPVDLGNGGSIVGDMAMKLKPHQVEGVKFMWGRIAGPKGEHGCILAHSMGLGKTLSVVTLIHSFARMQVQREKKCQAIIVCPTSLISNWRGEFSKWMPQHGREGYGDIKVFTMESSKGKTASDRAAVLRAWQRQGVGGANISVEAGLPKGSVLVIGFEMFKNLATDNRPSSKKYAFQDHLFAGPDLIVLDEGHRMRNSAAAATVALSQVKTRRRVVLTGTPLQNNLGEYHCMADFVEPNFLGSKRHFQSFFAGPISQGMTSDASKKDVRFGKRRAYILRRKLDPLVQRRDDSVLKTLLPPKEELVIYTALSSLQLSLYRKLLEHHARVCPAVQSEDPDAVKCNHTLCAHACIQRLVNHPDVLRDAVMREAVKEKREGAAKARALRGQEVREVVAVADGDDAVVVGGAAVVEGDAAEVQVVAAGAVTTEGFADDGGVREEDETAGKVGGEQVNSVDLTKCVAGGEEVTGSGLDFGGVDEESGDGVKGEGGEVYGLAQLGVAWGKDDLLCEGYRSGVRGLGGKMEVLLQIMVECRRSGEKCLVFSQSVATLNSVESFVASHNAKSEREERLATFRLDGSTPQAERQQLVNRFNTPASPVNAFLISTGAGGVGLNLTAASRVVIVDSSWNPAADAQAAMRAYRIGQTKPVFVYRLIAAGTMEQFVYDRQVAKSQLSKQVVDKTDVTRIFTTQQLTEMFRLEPHTYRESGRVPLTSSASSAASGDAVLQAVIKGSGSGWITKLSRHDDATEEDDSETLTKEEEEEAEREEQYIARTGVAPPPPGTAPPPAPSPHLLAPPQAATLPISVPQGCQGGSIVQFVVGGMVYQAVVPQGLVAGQVFHVAVNT